MLRVHNPSGGSWVSAATPFRGATENTSGRAGLVPGPAEGQQDMVLLGSGSFGLLTGSNIYIFDRYNLCGEGVGEVVTLQEWSNAIAGKLQARTIVNYTDQSDAQEVAGDASGGASGLFQKEYVVDTYGLAGESGESVTTATLTAAIADLVQDRTLWVTGDPNAASEEEEETPTEPDNNEEEQNNEVVNPGDENTPEESTPVEEPSETEDDPEESLKDQVLNME